MACPTRERKKRATRLRQGIDYGVKDTGIVRTSASAAIAAPAAAAHKKIGRPEAADGSC